MKINSSFLEAWNRLQEKLGGEFDYDGFQFEMNEL